MVVLFSKRCLSATAQHPPWSFPGLLAEELFCVTRRPSMRGRDTVSPDTRLRLGLHTCVCVMRVQPCAGTDGQHVPAGKGGTSTDACPVASGSGCSAEDRLTVQSHRPLLLLAQWGGPSLEPRSFLSWKAAACVTLVGGRGLGPGSSISSALGLASPSSPSLPGTIPRSAQARGHGPLLAHGWAVAARDPPGG